LCPRASLRARWVDRARGGVRRRGRSTREETDVCPSRPAGTRPWRGVKRDRWLAELSDSGRTMLFDGEACAKGTALVAKAREDAMRVLGRNAQRAEVAVEVEHAEPRMIELGRSSRGDARLSRPIAMASSQRTPRTKRTAGRRAARSGAVENAGGERNPTRGGSTHWARAGRDARSWMRAGRPRVMR